MIKTTVIAILLTASTAHAVCGDLNNDGQVTATDAALILQRSVGLDVALSCDFAFVGLAVSNEVECAHGAFWVEYDGVRIYPEDFHLIRGDTLSGEIRVHIGDCTEFYFEGSYPLPSTGLVELQVYEDAFGVVRVRLVII